MGLGREGEGRVFFWGGTPRQSQTFGEERGPGRAATGCPRRVHRRTVGSAIPWQGCVPAEPASVSPSFFDRKAFQEPNQQACRRAGMPVAVNVWKPFTISLGDRPVGAESGFARQATGQ